jgi:hypothetical protein
VGNLRHLPNSTSPPALKPHPQNPFPPTPKPLPPLTPNPSPHSPQTPPPPKPLLPPSPPKALFVDAEDRVLSGTAHSLAIITPDHTFVYAPSDRAPPGVTVQTIAELIPQVRGSGGLGGGTWVGCLFQNSSGLFWGRRGRGRVLHLAGSAGRALVSGLALPRPVLCFSCLLALLLKGPAGHPGDEEPKLQITIFQMIHP